MLQFITDLNSGYSAAEQAQMFGEAGGMWIQLSTSRDNPDLRDEVMQIMEIAKGEDSFLILDHDVELVNELKVHGVHLAPGDMLPAEARELLGPHAVIGVSVRTAPEVIALKKADIDYVHIGPYPDVSVEDYSKIVEEVRGAGVEIPIVATGRIGIEDIPVLMETGISGIAMCAEPLKSENPVEYFRSALAAINRR